MKKALIFFSILLLVFSCQKLEFNNPFDPNCPKEVWTPTDFKAVQNGTTVTLSWSQPINKISGFKLTKKIDTGTASDLQSQTKSATQIVDANLTGGKLHTYTIVAYADNNLSNSLTATVTPILSASGVSTTTAGAITAVSAASGGTIPTDGGSPIIARGVCWATTTAPTIAGSKSTDGTGTGTFTSSLTGLAANTTYFVRAYAINAVGTTYGNEVSFKTLTGVSTISTTNITGITATTASSGGNIAADGGAAITARGICWGTATNPTIAGNKTTDGVGIGTFASSLTGLIPGTAYFARAYASNVLGTYYGNEVTYRTPLAPILFNSSKTYGTMSDLDGNTYKTIQIGTQLWMAENLKTTKYKDGSAIPLVTDNIAWANLTAQGYCWYNNDMTTYKEVCGALYNWYTVQTNKLCPNGWHVPTDLEWTVLTTYLGGESTSGGKLKEQGTNHWGNPNTGATNESGFTAVPGGYRSFDGPFSYLGGTGHWWTSTESSSTNSMLRSTHYLYGNVNNYNDYKQGGYSVRCISGDLTLPTLTTLIITNVASTSATSGGNITSDGGTIVTARGVCWSTTQNPTIADNKTSDGNGVGNFASSITGLSANTKYFTRSYATNSVGTSYGNEVSFTTSIAPIQFNTSKTYGSVTDADGNIYKTIQIGTQLWMAENLKTTKYRDGLAIPLVIDNTAWAANTTPGYCWYNNDATTYKNIYGALYNWYTVNTNKLCPTGWHVPTDSEWTVLITYMGGENVSGGKLKETGTSHWITPNTGATNEYGFSALPGGYRSNNSLFYFVGFQSMLWSSDESPTLGSLIRHLDYQSNIVSRENYSKYLGLNVRCISGDFTLPSITTTSTSSITSTSATLGGNISSDGGTAVTARGVCWSTATAPTIANTKTSDGTGTGSFTSSISGLTAGTTYYVRSYATNSAGTAYGNEVSFTTYWNTQANAGPDVAICSSTSYTVTAMASNFTSVSWTTSGSGIFTNLNTLTPTYFPSSADLAAGSVTLTLFCYGAAPAPASDSMLLSFLKTPSAAGVIAGTTAVCQGQSTTSYSIPAISNATSYEWTYSGTGATITGTTNSVTVSFSSSATSGNLSVRGVNACGNGVGSANFTIVINPLPTAAGLITGSSTVTQGQSGLAYSVPAIANATGYSWTVPSGANIATGATTNSIIVNFSSSATSGNISVKGTNSCGNGSISASFPITVNPLSANVSDVDGNIYSTVTIGTQVWMASNLKTTKYKDGSAIPLVTDNTAWSVLTTPGYCWYNNDATTYKSAYSALYNFYTVNTGKLCPTGWHVPTDSEWITVVTYLGGENIAGGKLMETGNIHWSSPNTDSTNEAGFTAVPGGYRSGFGTFGNVGDGGFWWSSTESTTTDAWYRSMVSGYIDVFRDNISKRSALSVRCIKD
ncbi:MAG: FISUMP domain-containing protein [Prolixibacteraceae bacterium]